METRKKKFYERFASVGLAVLLLATILAGCAPEATPTPTAVPPTPVSPTPVKQAPFQPMWPHAFPSERSSRNLSSLGRKR